MNDPMISVLLPTRRRQHLAERSIHSLLSLARDPGSIEIGVIWDLDDDESQAYFTGSQWRELCDTHGAKDVQRSVARMGYSRLNEYLNILAPATRGDWLLFWNDDALMETQHWDDHVRANRDFHGLLHIHCRNVPMRCSIWPLFPREWIHVHGMVSPNTFSDSWISDVCIAAKTRRVIPVVGFHDRFEETGNNQDSTWAERSYANRRQYHSEENKVLRQQWAQRWRQAAPNRA